MHTLYVPIVRGADLNGICPENIHGFGVHLFAVLCWVALCGFATDTRAVVDANSQANTNAPADGSPWANVGKINSGGGIYLANGWVLTAAHVGAGNIVFDSGAFAWDGTSVRLTNADSSLTDLLLFHLSTTPSLPTLTLSAATPSSLSPVDMIGFGHIAGSSETNFGSYTGFLWSAGQFKSWGNNKINTGGVVTNDYGSGNVTMFSTSFTAPGTHGPAAQTSDEGQGSTGDSGGAVFFNNGSTWELAGVMLVIDTLSGQPSSSSVYGQSTYSADIATYRSEILTVIPEPSSLGLAGLGLLSLFLVRRNRVGVPRVAS